MDSTRIVTNPDGMTDIWRATDLEFIDFWERATTLGDLYERWKAVQRREGDIPRTADFELTGASGTQPQGPAPAPDHMPDLFHADADPAAPVDFRITAPDIGLHGAPLGTLFRPILRNALFSDLMLCRGLRKPLYQQIYQKVSGDERCYVRLLLPTIDGRGDIRRIFGASRPLYAEQELVHWSAS